tara:strand:- start:501 stop:674 length:174 start_codon:yes stop_codon:yes gene_type:complete
MMGRMKGLFTKLQDAGLTAEEIASFQISGSALAEYRELRRMKARREKERQEKELSDS